jgi:hypothetical protein
MTEFSCLEVIFVIIHSGTNKMMGSSEGSDGGSALVPAAGNDRRAQNSSKQVEEELLVLFWLYKNNFKFAQSQSYKLNLKIIAAIFCKCVNFFIFSFSCSLLCARVDAFEFPQAFALLCCFVKEKVKKGRKLV